MVAVLVRPEDVFGDLDQSLQLAQSLSDVPEEFHHIAAEANFENEIEEIHRFRVTSINGDKLTLDGNHPLVGKTLKFFFNIQRVRDATEEEIHNPDELNSPALH